MRGAPDLHTISACRPGIIPADAGSTQDESPAGAEPEDHPRGCGEHRPPPYSNAALWGSSPRMRGAHQDNAQCSIVSGIIPADAGSTHRSDSRPDHQEDHPRGCGEHLKPFQDGFPKGGSSPRMRGALTRQAKAGESLGIIPADAGSTESYTHPSSR